MPGTTPAIERPGERQMPSGAAQRPARAAAGARPAAMVVSIFTGGGDWHYAIPLVQSLARKRLFVEVVGSDHLASVPGLSTDNVSIHNLHGNNAPGASLGQKVRRTVGLYLRMIRYAAQTDASIFHILWLSSFPIIDAAILLPYFRLLGKRLVFTAHNIDASERDGRSSSATRWKLRLIYRLMDHIFVHTRNMKRQLEEDFGVAPAKVTVIPFGLNTVVPDSDLTRRAARETLRLAPDEKVILFFGNITAYKGLEYLLEALALVDKRGAIQPKLVIAGRVKDRRAQPYYQDLLALMARLDIAPRVLAHVQFIPDEKVEAYFKAADVCVLPYATVFQTGVLFLAYRFGLPAIATDVGAIREDLVEGRTGLVCRPRDSKDLADAVEEYFNSEMYRHLDHTRGDIRRLATERYSWDGIAHTTQGVYEALMMGRREGAIVS
jgi:glycosyltransferase involved in cell wall biosynthesis